MKTVLIILGIIILLAGISTLAAGLAYTFGPHDKNPNSYGPFPSHKDEELLNIKTFKISAVVLGITILIYALLSKFGKNI